MSVKYIKEFIYENYYKWIDLTKEDSYYSLKIFLKIFTRTCYYFMLDKLMKKVADSSKIKHHYNLVLKSKNKTIKNCRKT